MSQAVDLAALAHAALADTPEFTAAQLDGIASMHAPAAAALAALQANPDRERERLLAQGYLDAVRHRAETNEEIKKLHALIKGHGMCVEDSVAMHEWKRLYHEVKAERDDARSHSDTWMNECEEQRLRADAAIVERDAARDALVAMSKASQGITGDFAIVIAERDAARKEHDEAVAAHAECGDVVDWLKHHQDHYLALVAEARTYVDRAAPANNIPTESLEPHEAAARDLLARIDTALS